MNSTFDIFSIKSVPSTYSWDKGIPALEFTDLVTELSSCEVPSITNGGVEYVGYAPFVSVALSSEPGSTSDSFLALKRVANFGDYYNSESNLVTTTTLSNEAFCHAYIMPGLYSIKLDRIEYTEVPIPVFNPNQPCFQKHCINWSWRSLITHTTALSVTWRTAATGNRYEKKWKFELCDTDWASNNNLYSQIVEETTPELSWQWYNFLCNNGSSNSNTNWSSTEFQQTNQLTWAGTTGPCITLNPLRQVIWKWDKLTRNISTPMTYPITWDDVRSISQNNITWDQSVLHCNGAPMTVLSSTTQTITKEAYIRVLEIFPVAYLEAIQPTDKTSPVTVRLSPSKTICGSFPIEKIVWDLGDGSPLLIQRRWSNTLEEPFVYTGAISADYQDPRNYDVVHTYTKTAESEFSFYPSITAYASSTNSSDCAATVVGPIKLSTTSGTNFRLLQNELTEHGKVLIGRVNNNIAVWRADK